MISRLLRRSLSNVSHSSPAVAALFPKNEVDPEVVESLFRSNPALNTFSEDILRNSLDLFRNQGFTAESFLRIINKNPRILKTNPSLISNNLELWRASQFGERYVQILVTEHPQLLDMKVGDQFAEQKILQRLQYLKDYVQTKKNVWRLLVNSPNVVVDKITDVEEKRKYFEDEMRVEHTEVVKTFAFSHSMFHIRLRHEFLLRLGMFKQKKLKPDPTVKNTNPSLYQILDTNDKRFATKVSLVSLEEFEVFKEIFQREQNRQRVAEESEDDDDSDWENEEEIEEEELRK